MNAIKKRISRFMKSINLGQSQDNTVSTKRIKQEADRVFVAYQKTFKDLARYDRGEKINLN